MANYFLHIFISLYYLALFKWNKRKRFLMRKDAQKMAERKSLEGIIENIIHKYTALLAFALRGTFM